MGFIPEEGTSAETACRKVRPRTIHSGPNGPGGPGGARVIINLSHPYMDGFQVSQ